jgi:hypothetical protein
MGRTYSGMIDIPNENLRTTDLLNSANLFWRDPNEKCLNDAILLYDVKLLLDESAIYKKFDKVQIRIPEIIFFFDEFETLGNSIEKDRAHSIKEKTGEKSQVVNIITPIIANSFYDISGTFYGHFKKKTNDKFIPLINATVAEIHKTSGKWQKKGVTLPCKFLGISSGQIESLSIGSD